MGTVFAAAEPLSTKMRVFFLLSILVPTSLAKHCVQFNSVNLTEFRKSFHKTDITDAVEEELRSKALAKHIEEIKKQNKRFSEGNSTWFDCVYDFDDLTDDEFRKQKTGAIIPEPENQVDDRSENFFDNYRYSRMSVPASYSSVDRGYVSPVKDQGDCGSCVAFATMATVETCYKKLTGVFGDYSEQQLVDCGYGQNGANGCQGASAHSYAKWAGDRNDGLAHESQYPYLNTMPNLDCPANLPVYNQGAKVSGSYYTYEGDEDLMKKLVYENGAVVALVKSAGPFKGYGGGVFSGCAPGDIPDHAVAVVGYGTENGVDYWLIKNSWGPQWGENGYIKLERGSGMCGIGRAIAGTNCSRVSGPTEGPRTTKKPCIDKYSNCPDLARTACYQDHIANGCQKSCGLCQGMTPARSYTCYNKYSNCANLLNRL